MEILIVQKKNIYNKPYGPIKIPNSTLQINIKIPNKYFKMNIIMNKINQTAQNHKKIK